MTERAGIWIRVSTGGQDEANQVPDLEKHCTGHGYDIERRYEVHGKSASKGHHQKDLDRMLADMRAGVITVLVIWHSDRIERRKGKMLLDLLEEISEASGRVESVQEPTLGKLDFGGQVTTFIAGLVNHEKSAHLSEQVGLAQDRIRKNGALGGRPSFGYATEGTKYHRKLVPTEQGRKLVPEVYQRVIDSEPLPAIAAWLQEQTGRTWWAKTVATLVRNPVYKGRRCALKWAQKLDESGKPVEKNGKPVMKFIGYGVLLHECEPLVDAAVWRRANDNLDARPKRGRVYAENRAMLATALYCPDCADSPMYRIKSGHGNTALYYRCAGRGPQRKGCGLMVRAALVDAAADAAMSCLSEARVEFELVPGHDHKAELEQIEDELANLPLKRLPRAEEQAERERLWAEQDRVAGLPVVLDEYRAVATSESYAELWTALEPSERGPWLTAQRFRLTASREQVTVYATSPQADGTWWERVRLASARLTPAEGGDDDG